MEASRRRMGKDDEHVDANSKCVNHYKGTR